MNWICITPQIPFCPMRCAVLLVAAAGLMRASEASAQTVATAVRSPPAPGVLLQDPSFAARLERGWQYHSISRLIRDATPPQWFPEGDRFVHWAPSGMNAGTWVEVDARTGGQKALISPADLKGRLTALLGKEALLPPNLNFKLDAGGGRLLFNHEGRAFALTIADGRIVSLAPDDPSAGTIRGEAVASPDGGLFAVPKSGGFAVVDRGGRTLLERRGEENWNWQVPPKAWSPDGRLLIVGRVDRRKVHKIPIVEYRDTLERVNMVPYVKSGTPLARAEFYVVDPAAGTVAPIPATAEEAYSWLAGWRPDGSEALLLHMSRDGKRVDLAAANATNRTTRLVLREERPESFVAGLDFASFGWQGQVTPLKDNRRFLWLSERDGWRHLYLYDYSGRLERQVTRGRYVVHEVAWVSPTGTEVFAVASEDGPAPYDRRLYRVNPGGGRLSRISAEPGDHQISFSPSGNHYADIYSTLEQPRRAVVRSVDGRVGLEYAKADVSRLSEIGYVPPERLQLLAADGTTPIYGVLYKPADFDPAKHYPVINFVYGGPWLSIAPRGYGGFAGFATAMPVAAHAMAQLGFIVVIVDNRGTPGRSKAFQDVVYGRVGQTEIPDQIAALRQAAASRPYMDLNRVGIYGHSWGGYFALRGMLTAAEFYKAGYAGAAGAFEEAAVINEPYMDLPARNPQGYEAGSNLKLAGNLRGALKLMHGTSDVNASLSTTMLMADALIRANKFFEMLIMPNQPHSVPPPFTRYYFEDQMRFFTAQLGGPRR